MGECWPKPCLEFDDDSTCSSSSDELGHLPSSVGDSDLDRIFVPYQILRRTDSLGHLKVAEQQGKDVWEYYAEVKVIGEGSMGKVSKVRKRANHLYHEGFGKVSWNDEKWFQKSDDSKLPKYRRLSRRVRSTNDLLASSSCSQEFQVTCDLNVYALKSILFSKINDPAILEEMRNEISILRGLDHPNIVKPIEFYVSPNDLCCVMELLSGGDLYTRAPYSERQSVEIVEQLLSAVAHMHRNNIIHRDIKFENILFENNSKYAEIKVIDFGLSKRFTPKSPLCADAVGTVYSMAPQVFTQKYDSKSDMWSIGVVSFMLLSSTLPFYGDTKSEVVEKILRCKYAFNNRRWMFISDEAKSFITSLLQYHPEKRKSARLALRSSWLKKKLRSQKRNPDQEFLDQIQAALETYATYSRLKKVSLAVIAHTSSLAELINLRRAFKSYDIQNTGVISYTQFCAIMENFFYSEAETDRMFEAMDLDKRGVIHYTEFLAAVLEVHGSPEEDKIREAFLRFDNNSMGYLTKENLQRILGPETSQTEIDNCMMEVDTNKDGIITYEDFKRLFKCQNDKVTENFENILLRRRLSTSNLREDIAELIELKKKRMSSGRTTEINTDRDSDSSQSLEENVGLLI